MANQLDSYVAAYDNQFKYAFDNTIMLKWYPRRIMALTRPQDTVLELGIGHGYTSNLFSHYYSHYSVIDASAAVIAKFKQHYPDTAANVVECYFEQFASSQRYDVIVAGFILEHVDDPALVLRHFRQFLKPGGTLFVAVPNAQSLHRRFGHAAGLLPDMMQLGQGDLELGHQRLYTVASLAHELEQSGYRVTRREGIFMKPFTTDQLVSMKLGQEVLESMCVVGVDYPELCAGLLFQAEL